MTRKTRKIILLVTILFFILITPATLLYAWGYSFDWENKKAVITGSFYFKSIPKKADIYINDKLEEGITPTLIKRLLPKEYKIRINKEGYHSWQKTLKIESKKVTEAKNILLIPLNPEIEIIDQDLSIDFSLENFLKEESDYVFYIKAPSYILYKTDKENSFNEQISLTPLPSNYKYKVFASANEQIVVLDENNQLYLLNQKTKEFELISQDVQNLQFSNDNKKLLYFTPYEIWIYHLKESDEINDNKELVTRLSQKIEKAIWYNSNEHIVFYVEGSIKIVELDNRGDRNIVSLIKLKIEEMAYSPKDKKLYLTKDNELLSISLEN